MTQYTMSTSQAHFRGIPGPRSNDEVPGSIVEHLSTSMKVVLLRCSLIEDPSAGRRYELFDADRHLIEKTQRRFLYVGRRELEEKCLIHYAEDVRLLVPKSLTELRHGERNIQLTVWPKVFVCNNCNRILSPSRQDVSDIVNAGVFKTCVCGGGEYRQSPHILQCKICGSIRNIPSECNICHEPLSLNKGSETDIETWRLECGNHHVSDFNEYPEVYLCDGEDHLIPQSEHREIAEGRKATRTVMTTVGRGICSPLVYRFPIGEDNPEMANDELLLVACNSHKIELDRSNPPTQEQLQQYDGLNHYEVRGFNFTGHVKKDDLIRRCEDWVTLLSSSSRSHGPIDLNGLEIMVPSMAGAIRYIREELGILQLQYIEDVAIVSGTYGMVRGSVHPIYKGDQIDPVKVPLTNVAYDMRDGLPLVCDNAHDSFPVIVTKRRTEGLAFIIAAKNMMRLISGSLPTAWTSLNEVGQSFEDFTEEEARAWLMYACHDEEHGEAISELARTVVHTISHAIIHRFAKASGLRDQDLGELLFPEFAGFALYNGLEKPLGMLRRVFEDGLGQLLNPEIMDEVKDCDMDPTCRSQQEGAACHACLHVPEHVCERFNSDLNRLILIGTNGYWQ